MCDLVWYHFVLMILGAVMLCILGGSFLFHLLEKLAEAKTLKEKNCSFFKDTKYLLHEKLPKTVNNHRELVNMIDELSSRIKILELDKAARNSIFTKNNASIKLKRK